MLQEELDCVCVPVGCSDGDVEVVTAVMVEVGANVTTVNCMCGEGGSVGGRFVD